MLPPVLPGEPDDPDDVFQSRIKRFLQQDRIVKIRQFPEVSVMHVIRRCNQNAVGFFPFQQLTNTPVARNLLQMVPFTALTIFQIIRLNHAGEGDHP